MAEQGQGASFGIDLKGNAREVSKEMANAMLDLGSRFTSAKDRSRELQESLRGLSGKSAEVVAAKAELKAAIDGEKTKMNEASLAVQKYGFAMSTVLAKQKALDAELVRSAATAAKKAEDELKRAADAAKAAAKGNKDFSDVVKGMGGPLADAQEKVRGLQDILSGASVAELAVAGGAAFAAAAIVALTAVVVAGTIAFAK